MGHIFELNVVDDPGHLVELDVVGELAHLIELEVVDELGHPVELDVFDELVHLVELYSGWVSISLSDSEHSPILTVVSTGSEASCAPYNIS